MAEKLLKQISWCFLWHIQVRQSACVCLICLLPVDHPKVLIQLCLSASLIALWLPELWNDFAAGSCTRMNETTVNKEVKGACSTGVRLVRWEEARGRWRWNLQNCFVTVATQWSPFCFFVFFVEKGGSSSMSVVTKFAPAPTPTVEANETVIEILLLMGL